MTFGRLTVLHETQRTPRTKWLCRCSCGAMHETLSASLVHGRTTSCGCFRREVTTFRNTTHGRYGSPTYVSWNAMWQRCTNPAREAYQYYGARGIRVCRRWESFENFRTDLGERPPGLTLERRDSNKGYNKDNCYWATSAEQAMSRRSVRYMTHRGTTKCLRDWAKHLGFSVSGLTRRLSRLPQAQALQPKGQK